MPKYVSFILCYIFIAELVTAQVRFVDKTAEYQLKLHPHRIAFVDYNVDGWVDLYSGNTLWENEKGKRFKAVFSSGNPGVWGDYDNDGFPDLFCFHKQKLFHNDQGKQLKTISFPEFPIASCQAACWADVNNDSLIDLYICGYENWDKNITYPDVMVLNQNKVSFNKAFSENRFRARGVTACDFDQDGDMDLYVSNYRLQPNCLWRNDGKGNLKNCAQSHNATAAWEKFTGGHSIGAAWGDIDNDGLFDIFADNFAHDDNRGHQPHSCFLRNTGSKNDYKFEYMGQCGIFYQESYASPALGDYDNDGDLDLFITTVYPTASFGKKNYPVLFRNEGDWKFADVTESAGLSKLGATYQAAWGDIDNDGDLDLVTNGKLFINQGTKNHWLKMKLVGDGKSVNSDAIGAQVRMSMGNSIISRQVEAGTGNGNQNEMTLHIGFGEYSAPVDCEITWPGNQIQSLKSVKVDRLITVKYDENKVTAK